MARISGLCPCCGAGLSPGDVSTRPFQCSKCSAWLRVTYWQSLFRVIVLVLLVGVVVYRLGLRDVPFILVCLAAFWILLAPVYAILDRLLPWRPQRTQPPWGGLDLNGARGVRVGPQTTAEEGGQGDSKPGAGNSPEAPPPPRA